MNKKRSLDDTCTIFLSRRRFRSPLTSQRAASEYPRYAPTLRAENITPPFDFLQRPVELPELPATALPPSKKPLPLPGSSGELRPKPIRTTNGRHHVPRPRNPFILFRCDLVHQRKVLPRSDLDDTNISRIAGDLWREMTAAQKKPWIELAAKEKARHALLYPDYKYAPAHNAAKGKKGKSDHAHVEDQPPRQVSQMGGPSPAENPKPGRQSERPRPYPQPMLRRRSSSCPPVGAVPVQPQPSLDGWTPSLVSQDDIQRRPSRTVMYQSVTPPTVDESAAPTPAAYNPLLSVQGTDWLSSPQIDPLLLDCTYGLPDLNQCADSYAPTNLSFFEPKFPSDATNFGFGTQGLADMQRFAMGTAFIDPFSSLATIPVDQDSPYTFPTAIAPFDCSSYSTGSPSSLSSGTLSM